MKTLFILLLTHCVYAQYDPTNTGYDFIFFEIDPQNVESFNVRTFDTFEVQFTHNSDGEPSPGDIVLPDSLLNPTGNVITFTVPNEAQYWVGDTLFFQFSRVPFGTGYYIGYVRTVGGYPVMESDWAVIGSFLLRISASTPAGVSISGN